MRATSATYFIGACPNCGSNTIKGLYPGSPILAEDNETIIESKFAIVTCMDCEFEIRAKSMDEIISIWKDFSDKLAEYEQALETINKMLEVSE